MMSPYVAYSKQSVTRDSIIHLLGSLPTRWLSVYPPSTFFLFSVISFPAALSISLSLWNFSLGSLGEIWLENMKVLCRFWFTEFDGWSLNERFGALKEAQNHSISNCPTEANLWFSCSICFTNQPLILDLNLQDKDNCRLLSVDCCRIRINLGLWISKDLVDRDNYFPNSFFLRLTVLLWCYLKEDLVLFRGLKGQRLV